MPTASEASKIFTGHTFQIGLKCDYTLYKHNKQVTRVPTVHKNFQKFKCRRGGSVNFWGGSCPPKHPRWRHPCPNFFKFVQGEGASLASVERLFHILALRKERLFVLAQCFSWASWHQYLCSEGHRKNINYFY